MTLFASPHMLEPIVIIRQVAGSDDADGGWIPGTETRTEVSAVTAPATAGTWKHVLPKGFLLADYRQFSLPPSVGPIAPVRDGDGQTEGDVIEYKGTLYRVRDVQDWSVSPSGYAASGHILVLGERADVHTPELTHTSSVSPACPYPCRYSSPPSLASALRASLRRLRAS